MIIVRLVIGVRDNGYSQVWTGDTGGVLRSMISVKKVIFLFAIARLVKAGSITLPYPPEVKQAVLLYEALRGICSARTCCVSDSTAESSSARTSCIWLRGCKWQHKDQFLFWLCGCKWQCKDQFYFWLCDYKWQCKDHNKNKNLPILAWAYMPILFAAIGRVTFFLYIKVFESISCFGLIPLSVGHVKHYW